MGTLRRYLFVAALVLASACQDELRFAPAGHPTYSGGSKAPSYERESTGTYDYSRVFVLISLGFNNLSSDLREDILELCDSDIPNKWEDKAVVVFSHLSVSDNDWSTKTSPCLFRVYGQNGQIVRDTLKVYDPSTISADAATIRDAMSEVNHLFHSPSYGVVLSSHSTGWLPYDRTRLSGYSTSWEHYFFAPGRNGAAKQPGGHPAPYTTEQPIRTKAIGVQSKPGYGGAYQVNIEDFPSAFPMHLDYLILDACLSGSVEVLYALRNVADYLVASPTETLTDGHVYSTMLENLLYTDDLATGIRKCCQDFFDQYDSRSGWERSATIAMYRCSEAESLAAAAKPVMAKFRDAIHNLDHSKVQNYNYTYDEFYDFRDILSKAGADEGELAGVDKALSRVVCYDAATPDFIGHAIDPDRYCGISMYLPYSSRSVLNEFYRELSWNAASGLFE